MHVTLNPAVVAIFRSVENFVRKSGAWAIIVNDLTRTFHVSSTGGLSTILTAIAGSLIVVAHVAAKRAATPAPPAA